jgi:hypothetical protein
MEGESPAVKSVDTGIQWYGGLDGDCTNLMARTRTALRHVTYVTFVDTFLQLHPNHGVQVEKWTFHWRSDERKRAATTHAARAVLGESLGRARKRYARLESQSPEMGEDGQKAGACPHGPCKCMARRV